jgi:hypothetical protein
MADSIRSDSGTFTDNISLTKYFLMKTIRNYVLFACTVTLLSGCDLISLLATPEADQVCLEYDWWNNLLNVPVIQGKLRNNGYYDISRTTIEVSTFNSLGECLCTSKIDICTTIPYSDYISFKEWVSGSPEASSLTAKVVDYN